MLSTIGSYDVPTDTELFVFFPSDYPREVTLKCNGSSKGGFYGSADNSYRRIASIGKYDTNNLTMEITIKNSSNNLYFKQTGDLHDYNSYIYYIDWDVFNRVFPLLGRMNMEIDHASTDDHIFGTVRTLDANQTMATTIAYDEGWNVFVDGERVKVFETADALLTFRIATPGEHTVELKYMPRVVRFGIICSITCAIVYILLLILYRWLVKIPLLSRVFTVSGDDLPAVEAPESKKGIAPGDLGDPCPLGEPVEHTTPSDADEKPFRIPPKKPAADKKSPAPSAGKNPKSKK